MVLAALSVVKLWATARDGDQACSYQVPPEGAIVDESWERQPQAAVIPVPAMLSCTYVSTFGGEVIVLHGIGVGAQAVRLLLAGLGVVAVFSARRRDNHRISARFSQHQDL
jgi:hypothetical protein